MGGRHPGLRFSWVPMCHGVSTLELSITSWSVLVEVMALSDKNKMKILSRLLKTLLKTWFCKLQGTGRPPLTSHNEAIVSAPGGRGGILMLAF